MTALILKTVTLLVTLAIPAQDLPSTDAAPGIEIIDARPEKQKKSGVESLATSNCAYASARIGDREFGRDRIALLGKTISENFQLSSEHSIVVENYVIHNNRSVASRRLTRRMTGLLGAMMAAATAPRTSDENLVGCLPDDLTGGYTIGEEGVVNSPIVTVIDLVVDQRRFHFRSISDTYMRGDNGLKWRELGEANFQRAQSEAMTRFVPAFSAFLQETADGQ